MTESQPHPPILFPEPPVVLDFTCPGGNWEKAVYTIGRYDEDRVGVYETALFAGQRTVHIGIDFGAPAGTPVYACLEGEIFDFAIHEAEGDYGATLITKHRWKARTLYVLHGHLSHASLDGKVRGQKIAQGDVIATLGYPNENGGWPPHLHFQLSWNPPKGADMPGAVAKSDRKAALELYPDPQEVLGPIY